MRLKIVTVALLFVAPAFAAGGGGSAGGSGAQNSINSGRSIADGQPGPLGAVNHPRARQTPPVNYPAGASGQSSRLSKE